MQPQKALSSSVGSKFLIAFTGLALLLFLVAHLGGNLLFLLGPDAFNPVLAQTDQQPADLPG